MLQLRSLARRLVIQNRLGAIGLALGLLVVALALLAPVLTNRGPTQQSLLQSLKPPDASNILGTDHLGRDVLARTLFGLRVSLLIAVAGAIGAALVGGAIGLVAGARRGVIDIALMRLVDFQLSIPFLLVAIMWIAFVGNSLFDLVIVVVIYAWVPFARVVRDRTLVIVQKEFVTSAVALGASQARVILRHIAPHLIPDLVIIGTMVVGRAVILESSLGFLGLSVPPPTPTLGGMIGEARNYLTVAWWMATFPGLAILAIVLGVSLAGDGLRDALDPRMRSRSPREDA